MDFTTLASSSCFFKFSLLQQSEKECSFSLTKAQKTDYVNFFTIVCFLSLEKLCAQIAGHSVYGYFIPASDILQELYRRTSHVGAEDLRFFAGLGS